MFDLTLSDIPHRKWAYTFVDCFDLLCGMGGHGVSSLCVPPGLSSRDLLQPSLSDTGALNVAGVCFEVSGKLLVV